MIEKVAPERDTEKQGLWEKQEQVQHQTYQQGTEQHNAINRKHEQER